MTCVLIFFLIVAGFYAVFGVGNNSDGVLLLLCIGMTTLLSLLLIIHWGAKWEHSDVLLFKVLLLIGTMNALYATYDIWDDCVAREVSRSDASQYAEILKR